MSELADTSAWLVTRQKGQERVRENFDAALVDGQILVCDIVALELLSSAENSQQFDEILAGLDALESCPVGQAEWQRTLEVYRLLARANGYQRSIKHAELLVAAAAEARGVAVLHYDEDFDRIAAITGQPARWIVDKGSI